MELCLGPAQRLPGEHIPGLYVGHEILHTGGQLSALLEAIARLAGQLLKGFVQRAKERTSCRQGGQLLHHSMDSKARSGLAAHAS